MGQGIAAATLKRKLPVALADAVPAALAKGVRADAGRSLLRQETKRPDAQKAVQVRRPAESGHGRRRVGRLRPGDRSDRRKSRSQEAALRPARAATVADDAILASNTSTIPITQAGRGAEAARAVLRHPLLQSGAQDAAGRSDSRRQDQRRDGGHGRGLRQEHRQVADRGQRWAGLPGQSPAAAVHERGAGADLPKAPRSRRSSGRPRSSACRWARSRCTTWSGSTRRSTPAA